MKNTIKMSLAAAVAVSAFSTSAFAGNLEEMIKGVEVTGYVDYRLEDKSIETKAASGATTQKGENWNEYSVNVTVNSKVNDIVTATVSAGFDEITTSNTDNASSVMTPTAAGDTVAPVSVDQAYFTFAMGNTTVMAGKQNIPSVFVDQSDTVKQGAGIVAVQRISDAITLAGAHFLNNNIATDTKTSELIAMGTVGPVNYAFNYNMTDIAATTTHVESDRYSINVGATVGPVKLDVRHSAVSTDNVGTTTYDDAEVTKFSVSGKIGSVKLGALYAMTNDQKGTAGATATDVAIDGDNDAKVHAKVWQLSTKGLNDGDAYVVSASMPLMDKLTGAVVYAEAEGVNYAGGVKTGDLEADELLFKLTYKMSKNFTIHGRYSIYDTETKAVAGTTTETSTDYSRIQVKYTF